MNPRILGATIARVLRQLKHDHRTVAMVVVVPIILLLFVHALFSDSPPTFDRIGLAMLGIFPFIIMFLITSIAMLRERTTGTLERLLTTPMNKADLLFGYGVAFGVAAAVQATIATMAAYWIFGMNTGAHAVWVILVAVVNAVLGVSLGLLASAFARTEFQAVQFMPLIVTPQLLTCGLFAPRDQMAGWLQHISDFFPLTYSVEALRDVGINPSPTSTYWTDLAIVLAVVIVALVAAAATLRRRTA